MVLTELSQISQGMNNGMSRQGDFAKVVHHPRHVLFGAALPARSLPVCDHYSGTDGLMQKSLNLQEQQFQTHGRCLFDVTLDCEDGAPVGYERQHAALVAQLAQSVRSGGRVGVRVHGIQSASFQYDVQCMVGEAGDHLSHITLPKVESIDDIHAAVAIMERLGAPLPPIHALIESPKAVYNAFAIASHPKVESLSFGLMDFVSAYAGAIPAGAMGLKGQFSHPLVMRAKLAIAEACHAHGKIPSHGVVTEFRDLAGLKSAAQLAHGDLGYLRMWSIHPAQIPVIVDAFSPPEVDVDVACLVVRAAAAVDWAPISYEGVLHDRASYRYFWGVLERAHLTGGVLPSDILAWF